MLKTISEKKAEEILEEYSPWIKTLSERYRIPQAVIKAILYMEMTGRIDFSGYSEEELKLVLTRYNADTDHITRYGEEAYRHYLRYLEYEKK